MSGNNEKSSIKKSDDFRDRKHNDFCRKSAKSYSDDRDRSSDRQSQRGYRNRFEEGRSDSGFHYKGNSNRNERNRRDGNDDRHDRRRGAEENSREDGRPSWDNNRVKRHAEKIQERKLLWSKGRNDLTASSSALTTEEFKPTCFGNALANNNDTVLESAWTSRLAAATNDSKQMSKFQRLMGFKKTQNDTPESKSNTEAIGSDEPNIIVESERKRQEQLTSQLDRQYAMARAASTLGRGKGLGFNN